jgi:hypothetical protein
VPHLFNWIIGIFFFLCVFELLDCIVWNCDTVWHMPLVTYVPYVTKYYYVALVIKFVIKKPFCIRPVSNANAEGLGTNIPNSSPPQPLTATSLCRIFLPYGLAWCIKRLMIRGINKRDKWQTVTLSHCHTKKTKNPLKKGKNCTRDKWQMSHCHTVTLAVTLSHCHAVAWKQPKPPKNVTYLMDI